MESTGTLKGVTRSWDTGKIQLTFEFEQDISGCVDEIKDGLLTVIVKKFRKKRSLDANSYYWQLLSKLGDRLDISKSVLHNTLLREYGQPEVIDGKLAYLILPDSENGAQVADRAETFHIKPTSEIKTGADGITYRTYIMLRGSSTYDTKEMSHLINGLVDECKAQEIETMHPNELARMMEQYDRNWRRKNETI